jgi:hypothetical protein
VKEKGHKQKYATTPQQEITKSPMWLPNISKEKNQLEVEFMQMHTQVQLGYTPLGLFLIAHILISIAGTPTPNTSKAQ